MTITAEQVADLREGDVVEVHRIGWPEGATVRGALYGSEGGAKGLWVGDLMVRHHDGDAFAWQAQEESTLTVVSRAPRPLYVNHPRTRPVPGDVVSRGDHDDATWSFAPLASTGANRWRNTANQEWFDRDDFERIPVRLLVDGETGQVVP